MRRSGSRPRTSLKATAEEQVRRSWDLAPSWFGKIPSANCDVRLVEEFREADMPFAFYNPRPRTAPGRACTT